MNVCHVWDAEYPWDVRVEKVSRVLTEAGHQVHIVARNRDRQPVRERLSEGTVHRLAPLAIGRTLNAASMFPAFFNPRWFHLIATTARNAGAHVILCRDLPLAPTSIWAGRHEGIPVVLDLAENYAAMIQELWDTGRHRPLDWLIRNPRAVSLVERWVVPRVEHTLVVVDESRDRLVASGIPPERITVVSNTPPRSRVRDGAPSPSPAATGPLRLIYLGQMEVARGIGVLLDGVVEVRRRHAAVHLTLVGGGRDLGLFRDQAARLGLGSDAVTFAGHVPHAEALRLVGTADVGVVPHHADDSWNTTIPNKLFDYMAAGLPVLTSDAKPCARIVFDTGAGEVFRDRDPLSLAGAIARMMDAARRSALGAAGRRAIADRYNWEHDSRRLLNALRAVVDTAATQRVQHLAQPLSDPVTQIRD